MHFSHTFTQYCLLYSLSILFSHFHTFRMDPSQFPNPHSVDDDMPMFGAAAARWPIHEDYRVETLGSVGFIFVSDSEFDPFSTPTRIGLRTWSPVMGNLLPPLCRRGGRRRWRGRKRRHPSQSNSHPTSPTKSKPRGVLTTRWSSI